MTSIRYQLLSDYLPSSTSLKSNSITSTSQIISKCKPSPIVWYKDRGGKKNCIEIPVRLISSNNENVLGMTVPITVELIYSDGTTVDDQKLLEMNRESRLLEIGPTGQCILRIRITEVSSRHKGKLFALKISPDTLKAPHCKDISSVISNLIEVKSKLTPSHSNNSTIHINQLLSYSNFPDNNNYNNNNNSNNISQNNNQNQRKRSIDECYHNQNDLCGLIATTTLQTNSAIGEFTPSNNNSSSSSSDMMNNNFQNNLISQSIENNLVGSNEESIKLLQFWSLNVVNQLSKIKWVQIGQERSTSHIQGNSQPIYEMSNPNQIIDEIIYSYNQIQQQQQPVQPTNLTRDISPSVESIQSQVESLGSNSDDNEWDFDSLPSLLDTQYPTNSLSLNGLINNNEFL